MTFILLAILMIAIAAAFVAIPLWRSHASEKITFTTAEEGVYRKQLAELAHDLANGVLAENDYQSAIRDLESERNINRPKPQTTSAHVPRHRHLVSILATLSLVIGASLLYWRMGNWRVGAEGVDAASHVAIEGMVQQLADRLHTTGQNDLQGWLMLGHAYMLMERYQDAVVALGKARKLAGDDNAEVLSAYAEAISVADPDHFMQRGAPLFEDVLKLDPTDQKALWYGAMAASQRGDNELAIRRWQLLLDQNLPEKYSNIIKQYIVQSGGTVATSASPHMAAAVIHLHVTLSTSLKVKTAPDDTVFVFARPAGEQSGPPLAVKRIHVHDLPMNITLSDQDAMIAGRSLSDFDTVELVARISKDGSPLSRPGEPSGTAIWKRGSDAKLIDITIDKLTR